MHYYHIDVVFCKGGYVALPVVFASRLLRIPLIVHESDVHP
ncbi:MAG: glycosyltransferase [Candidatus Peribacteria bacterium]|nr:glycosyltransferase [Candidatus Peribacteria bacterium]